MNAPIPGLVCTVRAADLGSESARIDAFVAEHPEATLFHRPQWSLAADRGTGQRAHFLVAEQGGALAGCLPLTHVRSRLFGDALVSAGFGTGGGILAVSDAAAAALAEEAARLAGRLGCGVELRGGPAPARWVSKGGTYSTFARPLPATEEELLVSIPRKQRAEVRRALGLGLDVTAGRGERDRAAHFRVYAESVRNLGSPVFPPGLFAAALDIFGDEAEIATVWHAGVPHATMLSLYFRGCCSPVWGGGTAASREFRANDLVWYEVMRRAVGRGCAAADFGRSKVGTGPWSRKRIWGFEETPLVYHHWSAAGAAPRDVNPASPQYRLRVAAWRRLPLWLANRAGPLIARGLG